MIFLRGSELLCTLRDLGSIPIVIPVEHIFCFMDDLTIALEDATEARKVAKIVKTVLKTYGLEVNEASEKSSAISTHTQTSSLQTKTRHTQ